MFFAKCASWLASEKSSSEKENEKENETELKPTKSEEVKVEKVTEGQQYYGYNWFPERHSNKRYEGTFNKGGKDNIEKIKCEDKVYEVVQKSPLVKLMLSALKSAGCEIDIRRHISCEYCDTLVTGGFDPELNQVVICQNVAQSKGIIQGVLTHELIHMFDKCRAELDFKDIRHLACTEIRAANLTHCSFMSAMAENQASLFNIGGRHAVCVKNRAVSSIVAVRQVSVEEATAVVNSVFDKCYNDLEPIGRRVRRNSSDPERCYYERHHYGYDN